MKWLNPLNSKNFLQGEVTVPSDKSIAQRSVILASIAGGITRINGFPLSGDPLSTLQAIQALGVQVEREKITDTIFNLKIFGKGINGLNEPKDVLNCGNSGTGLRLIMGLLAGHPKGLFVTLTGDESLRSRPMKRITEPLMSLGAQIWGREGSSRAPIALVGKPLKGGQVQTKIASAQLKSALLLSCLNAQDTLTLTEPAASRNHTEVMLKQFGANLQNLDRLTVKLEPSQLKATEINIPGDISSAAFLLVAGTLVRNSKIKIKNVGLNPSRSGVISVLQQMGAKIEVHQTNTEGEPYGEISVQSSDLKGIEIGGDIIPNIIDELPIIALAASQASGQTVVKNAEELRVKESDRLKSMFTLLSNLGVQVEETADGLIIEGLAGGDFQPNVVNFQAGHDHRIAMTVGIASLLCSKPVYLEGAEWADVSFPGFFDTIGSLVR
jgi:3-phosphoshikimate 1-carboxyvinyltransferase